MASGSVVFDLIPLVDKVVCDVVDSPVMIAAYFMCLIVMGKNLTSSVVCGANDANY